MYEVSVFFPQTATALRRNTRPSAHDAPLPVYGQGIVNTGPLPHYPAGKVSLFFHPCQKYKKILQFDKRPDSTGKTGKTIYGLPALEVLIFPVQK